MIIDTHAHLTDPKFNEDRDAVLQRAVTAGVDMFFEIGCESGEWNAVLELAKKDNIFAVFGIHPLYAKEAKNEDFARLEKILGNKKAIALGEIGLDYHYDPTQKEAQKELFIRQLALAEKLSKPVVIHCREAYEDTLAILKNYSLKGVIHCYLGDTYHAKAFVELGYLIGIDGPVTYKKSDELRKVVAETDISKLLIETDCPYLPPQPWRGKRNEPAYMVETLKAVAQVKNLSYEDAATIVTGNAKKLFLKDLI